MTEPESSPESGASMDVVIESLECRKCSTPFEVEVRYVRLGPSKHRLPRQTHCGSCQQEIDDHARAVEAERMAYEEAKRRRALHEAFAAMVPAKYRAADFEKLHADLQDELRAYWSAPSSVYLYGPPGTGKTYTAAALVRSTWGHSVRRGAWANVPILLDRLRRSMRKAELTADDIENLCHAPLTVLDDLGAEKPSEWVSDRLYVVVNHRYENELPTIYTSNFPLGQLADRIGHRIASRIVESAAQYHLDGKDRRIPA